MDLIIGDYKIYCKGWNESMQERNIGLDIMRIAAMLGIIMLHVLGVGGGNTSSDFSVNINYWIICFVNILAQCSVNLFGVLTGYLSYGKKITKKKRILELIVIVETYSILITLFMVARNYVQISSIREIITGIIPSLGGKYWYITCYAVLYFTIPYLNKLIDCIEKNEFKKLCIGLVVIFSVIPSIIANDIFGIEYGYSVSWLIVCYFIGAYIRKYGLSIKLNKIRYFFISSMCVLLIRILLYYLLGTKMNYMMSYISPFILFNAVVLLEIGKEMKVMNNKFLKRSIILMSTLTFDIYILHSHIFIFNFFMKDRFAWVASEPWYLVIIWLALITGLIFVICFIIAIIRMKLFKLLKVNNIIACIEKIDE